jgi:hypothetical protein
MLEYITYMDFCLTESTSAEAATTMMCPRFRQKHEYAYHDDKHWNFTNDNAQKMLIPLNSTCMLILLCIHLLNFKSALPTSERVKLKKI